MTEDSFRDVALSFNGAIEGSHMGHADFRANGRIFASLHGNDRSGMVKLRPEQQAEFLREHPTMFEPSSGAWGRQGCTSVLLASAKTPAVRSALLLAWQGVMEQPAAKSRAKR